MGEFQEELRERDEAISIARQEQDRARIQFEEELKKALNGAFVKSEERRQSFWVKVLPSTTGLVTSAFAFLGNHFEQVPHSHTISLVLLCLVPGFVAFAAAEWVRQQVTLIVGKQQACRIS